MPHLSWRPLARLAALASAAVSSSVQTPRASHGDSPAALCLVWDELGIHTCATWKSMGTCLEDEADRHICATSQKRGAAGRFSGWSTGRGRVVRYGEGDREPSRAQTKCWTWEESKHYWCPSTFFRNCLSLSWQAAPLTRAHLHPCKWTSSLSAWFPGGSLT